MTNIIFTQNSYKEFLEWAEKDKKVFARIDQLIQSISRTPFSGIGKPEPLKHEFSGFWSRRINHEHRLIYRVNESKDIEIASCMFHYK
jgi:toxin YoeB